MKRNVLIVYPGINLHNQAQAGGLEHLLSNVQGYASNNCRTFIICAYNNKILHKDKSGNIYFNIIYSRSSVYSGIAESTKKSTKANNLLFYLIKKIIDYIYQVIVLILVLLLNIKILHERSTIRFSYIYLIKKFHKNIKYVYEINDESYNKPSVVNADLTLVVDKQYYPSSGNYFVSPWPVSFQIANLPDNSKKKYRIVYLGSALAWHDFEYMVRIVNTLGDQWKIDVYAPEESRDIVEKYSKKLCFCGFVSNDNISKELSKYKFGFALYGHNYGSKRNKVGSPMKVIHYLINDVIPIVNIVSDKNLKNKFPNIIDTSNMDVTDIVKEINLLRSNHEETSEHNKQYLVDMYSPENYYKKVLGILFKMNNV